ncbi:expressed unknown protein [Seminavis robusta]|uniref:Uncharacterized protein n=1 Tax=Seminavis robusta TaxID=568900 RepID=A0A9N8HNB1_9STRA|nr:expressed unknown protein [Seminavis robusta]|eukprot:Sro1068_g237520.1 n/a (92) ;mRNA; r:31993-32268
MTESKASNPPKEPSASPQPSKGNFVFKRPIDTEDEPPNSTQTEAINIDRQHAFSFMAATNIARPSTNKVPQQFPPEPTASSSQTIIVQLGE